MNKQNFRTVSNFSSNVCGYLRRSSANQVNNNSFEMQLNAIKIKANQLGLELTEDAIFIDEAKSAFKYSADTRKGLQELKRYIINNQIENLIIYDSSRADRSVYSFVRYFYLPIKEDIPNFEVYLTTQTEPWNPNNIYERIMLLLSSVESDDKRRRAFDAQIMQLERQMRPGSHIPYGYYHENKKLKVDEEQANIVILIYYLAAWGYSMDDIVSALNTLEIPAVRAPKWNKSTIEHILKNDVYKGTMVWNLSSINKNYIFESDHEPIVSATLYSFLQFTLELKKSLKSFDTPFLVQDLLFCSKCKEPMQGINKSTRKSSGKKYEYRYYTCKTCNYKLPIDALHNVVVESSQNLWEHLCKSNYEFMRSYLKRLLNVLPRLIDKKLNTISSLNQRLENLREKQVNKEIIYATEYVLSRQHREYEKMNQMLVIIERLDSDGLTETMINHFLQHPIKQFSKTELKVLLHLLLKEIIYHHKNVDAGITMSFRVSPFIKM